MKIVEPEPAHGPGASAGPVRLNVGPEKQMTKESQYVVISVMGPPVKMHQPFSDRAHPHSVRFGQIRVIAPTK
jgi:hypothetical protein